MPLGIKHVYSANGTKITQIEGLTEQAALIYLRELKKAYGCNGHIKNNIIYLHGWRKLS